MKCIISRHSSPTVLIGAVAKMVNAADLESAAGFAGLGVRLPSAPLLFILQPISELSKEYSLLVNGSLDVSCVPYDRDRVN